MASPLVLDIGSHSIKLGRAGDDEPSVLLRSIVANVDSFFTPKDLDQLLLTSPLQEIESHYQSWSYPVQRNIIVDLDAVEKLLDKSFSLQFASEAKHSEKWGLKDSPLLFTDALNNPFSNKEKLAELMFEKYEIPSLFALNSNSLALYASGRTSGLVVEIGEGVTSVVPIEDACAFQNAAIRLSMGGKEVTDYLSSLLVSEGYNVASYACAPGSKHVYSSARREIVRLMKEKMVRMPILDEEVRSADREQFQLPDGSVIEMEGEQVKASKVMTSPSSILDNVETGIIEAILESIMLSPADSHMQLYSRIVLCGGGSMLRGLSERVKSDVADGAPPAARVKVFYSPESEFYPWVGGSIFASLAYSYTSFVSKRDYEEQGHLKLRERTKLVTIW